MARRSTNNGGGCLCRVPIAEAAVPVATSRVELDAWAAANEVEILPDHMGRPSIDLPTAYRLFEQQQATVAAHRAAEEAKAVRERTALEDAQRARQKTHEQHYIRNMNKGLGSSKSSLLAWEAVHASEEGLPQSIKDKLGQVYIRTDVLSPTRLNMNHVEAGAEWS